MHSIVKILSAILIFSSLNSKATASSLPKVQKLSPRLVLNSNGLPRTQARLILDGTTGKILHKYNIDHKIYPASLTKLMTLYLTFEALHNKKITLNQKLRVPIEAEKIAPCKLGLTTRSAISVKDAIMALIVKSANDAAVVLAHALSDSEQQFAKKMTLKAKMLGMHNTVFHNASGWHHSKQYTTARDLAKLTLSLYKHFPQYYSYFSANSFNFKGKTIKGHNYVTANYKGAEGLKTGYTNASGYNLISVASRTGRRIIGIVIGENSARVRDLKMMALLDEYFPLTSISGTTGRDIKKVLDNNKQMAQSNKNVFTAINSTKNTKISNNQKTSNKARKPKVMKKTT